MEDEIKAYAESVGIKIYNVLATLDYDVIAERAMALGFRPRWCLLQNGGLQK